MKKFLLGMVLLSSVVAQAAEVEILGDSSTLRSSFDSAKYDLGIESSVTFEDEFSIKFISPIIGADVSRDLLSETPAVLGGVLEYVNLDLLNLKGAATSASFCSINAAAFTAANAACSAGATANDFKVSVDLSVAYAIKGSIQLDVVGMKDAHPAYTDSLVDLKVGGQALTSSMVILNQAKDMKTGLAGGDIASVGYAGAELDKDIEITFEAPFKGSSFLSQRGEIIKLAVVASSL